MEIKFTYLNLSGDAGRSQVVIFQRNLANRLDAPVVAWRVIRFCGFDCRHPFVYSRQLAVRAIDYDGNLTPPVMAGGGERVRLGRTSSGIDLRRDGRSSSVRDLQVVNGIERGAVVVKVYRAGRPLAAWPSLAPGQRATFRFEPRLFIGVVADRIKEEKALHPAVAAAVTTSIPTQGFLAADIVMTGGGPGPDSLPYAFHLENVMTY